jgi:hypothetical protein
MNTYALRVEDSPNARPLRVAGHLAPPKVRSWKAMDERFDTCNPTARLCLRALARTFHGTGSHRPILVTGPRACGKMGFIKQAWRLSRRVGQPVLVFDAAMSLADWDSVPSGSLVVVRRLDSLEQQQSFLDMWARWHWRRASVSQTSFVVATAKESFHPCKASWDHCIDIPPLARRQDDVLHLATELVAPFSSVVFDHEARVQLTTAQWQGEYPELANCVMHCVWRVRAEGRVVITSADVEESMEQSMTEHWIYSDLLAPKYARRVEMIGLKDLVAELEAVLIARFLEQCHGNLSRAAKYLKLPVSTLADRVKKISRCYPLVL